MSTMSMRLSRKISTTWSKFRFMSSAGSLPSSDSIDPGEIGFFGSRKSVETWWQEGVLHSLNDLRVPFIRDGLLMNEDVDSGEKQSPLNGVSIADIGCGAGILSEPLARLGADVTGIDASVTMIEAAKEHSNLDPALRDKITYHCTSVEELSSSHQGQFDAVVSSEVLEHVADLEGFVASCAILPKPGGSLFFTTINQTIASYIIAIQAAEISGFTPWGTHQYNKLVPLARLRKALENNGCHVRTTKGSVLNPLTSRWSWIGTTELFYAVHAFKRA